MCVTLFVCVRACVRACELCVRASCACVRARARARARVCVCARLLACLCICVGVYVVGDRLKPRNSVFPVLRKHKKMF